MKMFNLLGFGEHADSGVPDIFSIWREAGYVEPTIDEYFGGDEPNKTVVTLPLVEKEQVETEKQPKNSKAFEIIERAEKILELFKDNPTISRTDIARTLSLTEAQSRTAIDRMKKNTITKWEGLLRNGRWILF